MSKLRLAALLLALILTGIQCSKDSTPVVKPPTPTIRISSSEVGMGEALVAIAQGQLAGSNIRWWADSAVTTWKSAGGDSAIFLFTGSGSLHVYASFAKARESAPYDTSNVLVQVDDTLYKGLSSQCYPGNDVPFPSGEHLNIAPISYSDSGGLILLAYTSSIYDGMPGLLLGGQFSGSGGSYEIDLDSVGFYSCCGTTYSLPATNYAFLSVGAKGNYPLTIRCIGHTFSGSLEVLGNACAFTWNDSSLVTVYPQIIYKH